MRKPTTTDIWVFCDLRSSHLLDMSMKVLVKAAALAARTGDRLTLFALSHPDRFKNGTSSDDDVCVMGETIEEEAIALGADTVTFFESEHFKTPLVHQFAEALRPIIADNSPKLVLFPLTDFGRDLAARSAAAAGAGLMADCVELRAGRDSSIIGICPAWGGEIISEITYTEKDVTGFATVQPAGAMMKKDPARKGRTNRIHLSGVTPPKGIRLIQSNPLDLSTDALENARTVVVGGSGMGTIENFGLVRQLATALTGQIGATRPPVLNHWVAEDRLIGQTGKTVTPRLLISIATSGAVQYTAGIMGSDTIVAINRDPQAPIFRIADIGIVGDAATLLPLLTEQVKQKAMRQLADDICTDAPRETTSGGIGEKVKALREAQGWAPEQLGEITGQTPEFIAGVESGIISPPVAFMLRMANALQVDPGTFLREDEKSHIRDQRTQAYVNRTRNYSYQSLTSGAEHDHLRAFMITIEPHHDHKPVAYKHEGEEFIYVMEGELQFTLGSKVHTLKPGESIHFHSSTPHKLKSLSAQVTRCLVILYTI